jgi:hypothetical protein
MLLVILAFLFLSNAQATIFTLDLAIYGQNEVPPNPSPATGILTDLQESQLLSGLWYLNIHSQVLPGGEIRGQITEGTLTGDCNPAAIPVSNWAILFGVLLIAVYAFFMIRKRS